MKNLKKFFAFSIATAMVAGAVWAGTPGFRALAGEANKYWWNKDGNTYVQADVPPKGYDQVWKQGTGYTEVDPSIIPVTGIQLNIPSTYYYSAQMSGSSTLPLSFDDYVKVLPENATYKDVELTSSNPELISIDNTQKTVIVYFKNGTATITAKSLYNPAISVPKTIKVVESPTDIMIEGPRGLYVGEESHLEIYPIYSGEYSGESPDEDTPEVTWESSAPSVLEVKADGTIIGKRSGYATVTATAKDARLSELSDSVSIEVTKEGIELSPAEETIYVGGWAYINALIEHNSDKIEGDRITWSVDGSDKVYTYHSTDEDYWNDWLAVEGLKPGTAKITATVGSGKKAKSATSVITISSESSKQNATDPNAPTSEERAKQEQTPESIANYQNWLATYGGGDAAAAPVGVTAVSGEVGQPGSEAIVNTGTGEPVAMFQSNDTTNTLLAAPVGVVPSGTKIETVEAGKDTPAFKAVQNKLSRISRRGTVQKVYGIAGLNPDGSIMTLINGKAAMSMPMPTDITVPAGKSLKVYLIDDNGQTTKLDTAIDQGRVVFEIPKFGTFAFVVE